jgi:hemoglobin
MELFDAIGGMPACRKLAESFYGRVQRDPVLAPLFPSSLHCAIDAFTLFLAQFLGGPAGYGEHRWHVSLGDAHARFRIGPRERDAWVCNMTEVLHDTPMPADLRSGLAAFFEQSASWIAGQPEGAQCPHRQIAERWEEQRALELAVQAIHSGDPRPALALETDLVTEASLLALMLPAECVLERLRARPDLARVHHRRRRTLLHEAAASGSIAVAKLLLELGADVNAVDAAGHTPLYCLANECSFETGAEMVRLLVHSGADLTAGGGVQRCTPLHMAARRGSVGIAAALLNCGAPRDARDRRGDTPLMRAVNCKKTKVAALLAG